EIVRGKSPEYEKYEAVVGRIVADRTRDLVGQTLDLGNGATVRVVGVFAAGGSAAESEIYVPREAAARAALREENVSSVRVALDDGEWETLRHSIEQRKSLRMAAQREKVYESELAGGLADGIATSMRVVSYLTLLC